MQRMLFLVLVIASTVVGQASFELSGPACGPAFPVPCGAGGDPEGISWNGIVSGVGALPSPIPATVDAAPNGVGFPAGGLQYGRVHAAGPVAVAAGGPSPEGAASNQIYIPIPAGATFVTFSWDFYNADTSATATFNDGMAVDVIAVCPGPAITPLVYADSFTPTSLALVDTACGAAAGAGLGDVAPFGVPNVFAGMLMAGGGTPPFGSLLRVQVWNGGDNGFSSRGVIDCVNFDVAALPCVPNCSLFFSSPFGPGSLQIDNTTCLASAGRDYQIGVTLAAGAFPAGWFYGLDISLTDLIAQHDPVFFGILWGTLSGTGTSVFGPVGGLPSGLSVWAVTSEWSSPGFGGALGGRPAIMYMIP